MGLLITRVALDLILQQVRRDHPIESCGIVTAPSPGAPATRVIEMTNRARSETFFEFESSEQLRVMRELDMRDEECLVIYHSHTHSAAYPSRVDVAYASDPSMHYVIVSTWSEARDFVRSFRIIDGNITEETIAIVEG